MKNVYVLILVLIQSYGCNNPNHTLYACTGEHTIDECFVKFTL